MSDRASSRWMSSRLPAYARSAFTTTVRGPDVRDTLRSAIERMASIVSGSVDDGGELGAAGAVSSARKRGASSRLCSTKMSASAICRDSSGRRPVDTTSRSITSVRDAPTATCWSVRPGRGSQRTATVPMWTGSPSAADAWASSVALIPSAVSRERIVSAAATSSTRTRPSATRPRRRTDVSSHEWRPQARRSHSPRRHRSRERISTADGADSALEPVDAAGGISERRRPGRP